LEKVTSPGSGRVRVTGWVLDPKATAPIPVEITVDGVPAYSGTGSLTRSDIEQRYRAAKGVVYGFDWTIRAEGGKREVCAFGGGAGGGTRWLIGCADVEVIDGDPVGYLDSAAQSGLERIRVSGWAMDPDTSESITVRVAVDGVTAQTALADVSRPDVAKAYGNGDKHGYSWEYGVGLGAHQVCVYAVNAGARVKEVSLGCRTVTVADKDPLGTVDSYVQSGPQRIRISGWAMDPDTSESIEVRVAVDGVAYEAQVADVSRPDVAKAYGNGDKHGFALTFDAVELGSHQVCVYALNVGGRVLEKSIGCSSMNVA
jgi:hypothetical protein